MKSKLMKIKKSIVKIFTAIKYKKFIEGTLDPQTFYEKLWKDTKKLIRRSPFWQDKYHSQLENYEITTYKDYQAALDISLNRTNSLLNNEKIIYWTQSTGTTGKRKLFPITPSFQKQFQKVTPPFLHFLLKNFPNFMDYPVVYFAETYPQEKSVGGAPIGYISNFNYRNIPKILRSFYALPNEVFKEHKTYKQYAPLYALQGELSALMGITPKIFENFIINVKENFREYLLYLNGNKKLPPSLPPLKVAGDRLKYLNSLDIDKLTFKTLWPKLALICTWKTSVCKAQLKQIEQYIDDIPVVDGMFSATEGWLNVPIIYPDNGGPLHLSSHIVEFIPLGMEIKKENLLFPWELKVGSEYEIFLTTAMGFVRYRIFDIIRVTGYINKSPIIEFVRKEGSTLSLGEATLAEDELVDAACYAQINLKFYWQFAPNETGDGIVLYVDEINDELISKLEMMDSYLSEVNINYKIETEHKSIKRIQVEVVDKEILLKNRPEMKAQTKPQYLYFEV